MEELKEPNIDPITAQKVDKGTVERLVNFFSRPEDENTSTEAISENLPEPTTTQEQGEGNKSPKEGER